MIHVENLTRVYGGLIAVDNLSFSIGQREVVGLLGQNGAGKTTLLKMLTGFLEPTAGRIAINGQDLASARRAAQACIGYLPENDPLYPDMTPIDYLDYVAALRGLRARRQRIAEAIARTELGAKASAPIATLSRGYRQRLGVAAAIVHAPQAVILDEPTNGLDPTQVRQMRGLIRALAEQATVLVSTHVLGEVQAVCDRVIILRQGRKALDRPLTELAADARLLVTLDAAPEPASSRLRAIPGVGAVAVLERTPDDPGWRYALTPATGADRSALAASVARAMADAGWQLFALHAERQDLETLFGEIAADSATDSAIANGAGAAP